MIEALETSPLAIVEVYNRNGQLLFRNQDIAVNGMALTTETGSVKFTTILLT